MRRFEESNPLTQLVYYASVLGIAMFVMEPILTGCCVLGGVLHFNVVNRKDRLRTHLFMVGFFCLLALLNPLFNHRGNTILFVLNDHPITLEALAYGICAAGMIVGCLYWFRSFSIVMTSDRLLYLFGGLSPKMALVLSMSLRYVPHLQMEWRKIKDAQTVLGLYREDNLWNRLRGDARVFSILLTWALENGIVTAESMEARGYGVGKRTSYCRYRFRRSDGIVVCVTVMLLTIVVASVSFGGWGMEFYPVVRMTGGNSISCRIGFAAYLLLTLLPSLLDEEEELRWNCLQSKI